MTKLKTNLLELTDLENIKLKTVNHEGKRYYLGEDDMKYPSVTTVVGLHSKKQIKLWRERVGEKEANKITKRATKRGTSFHQHVEEYLRKEKDFIEIAHDQLALIDFKKSSKPQHDYISKTSYLQMTAYAIMVEELTGHAIEEICAIVAVEGLNTFQLFVSDPKEHVEELYGLRTQYRNLYGI